MTTRNNSIPGFFLAPLGQADSRSKPKASDPKAELERTIAEKERQLLELYKQRYWPDRETRKLALRKAIAELTELRKSRRQSTDTALPWEKVTFNGPTVKAAETEPRPASEIIDAADRAMEAILKQRQNQRFFEKAGIKKAEDILALEDNDYRDMLTAKAQNGLLDPRIDIFGED